MFGWGRKAGRVEGARGECRVAIEPSMNAPTGAIGVTLTGVSCEAVTEMLQNINPGPTGRSAPRPLV